MKKYKYKKGNIISAAIAIIMVLGAAGLRLLPHLPNFTPITAMALFAGMYFRNKLALSLPFVAMLISDYVIGFYDWRLMVSVYISFGLVVLLGHFMRNNKSFTGIFGAGILGSLIFFIVSNFAFWYFFPLYSKSLPGLAQAYLMGLPFLKTALAGDLFYVLAFFGAYELATIALKNQVSEVDNRSS